MKNTLNLLVFLLVIQFSYSQKCEEISPYKKGMQLEYTNFNKKGKAKSTENHIVESVTSENGNLTINIKSNLSKRSKITTQYILKCENGNFYVDMSNYTSLQNDNKNTFKIKGTGDFLEFPDDMKDGTNLKDGKIDLEVGDGGSLMPIASIKILNRKVIQNGSLTTKAGTFNGYKLSFDYVFDMGLLKLRGSGIEWYVKGIGIVKTENYNKRGKLMSYRELTKINGN